VVWERLPVEARTRKTEDRQAEGWREAVYSSWDIPFQQYVCKFEKPLAGKEDKPSFGIGRKEILDLRQTVPDIRRGFRMPAVHPPKWMTIGIARTGHSDGQEASRRDKIFTARRPLRAAR
jgi:hypothetical protein